MNISDHLQAVLDDHRDAPVAHPQIDLLADRLVDADRHRRIVRAGVFLLVVLVGTGGALALTATADEPDIVETNPVADAGFSGNEQSLATLPIPGGSSELSTSTTFGQDEAGSVHRADTSAPTETSVPPSVVLHQPVVAQHEVTTTSPPVTETVHAPTPTPPAQHTPTTAHHTTTTSQVAFSATQLYGSCNEDPPYDIFSGTAAPGATVTASSPYGSASTSAAGSGHWEMRVEFPSAPIGQTLSVTLASGGQSIDLPFVRSG